MLALVITLLVALYILGPELLSRWIMSWVVPRKYVVYSRSEEITRAFLWCVVPFLLSYGLCRLVGVIPPFGDIEAIKKVNSGLYSESIFKDNPDAFFAAMRRLVRVNEWLLGGIYAIVVVVSLVLNRAISQYGVWRHRLRTKPRCKKLLAVLVLPRVAEWHVLLSDMLIMDRDLQVHVDILTKGNILYRGALIDRMLGPDGSLVNITLESPQRFKRQEFLDERIKDGDVKTDAFWKDIEGNMFVVMESDITSINVRHTYPSVVPWSGLEDMGHALRQLRVILKTRRSADMTDPPQKES